MAERAGAPQKFLYTTTVAWVRLVAAAMPPEPAQNLSFARWVADHPRLLRKDCLSEFYSKAVLESPGARCGWVEPDLAPLPTQMRIVPGQESPGSSDNFAGEKKFQPDQGRDAKSGTGPH
jgi:hypothetical protein